MTTLRDSFDVDMDTHPLFCISVSDIELLKSKRTYIACEIRSLPLCSITHKGQWVMSELVLSRCRHNGADSPEQGGPL